MLKAEVGDYIIWHYDVDDIAEPEEPIFAKVIGIDDYTINPFGYLLDIVGSDDDPGAYVYHPERLKKIVTDPAEIAYYMVMYG